LQWTQGLDGFELIMLSVVRHDFAIEETAYDLDGLRESILANGRRVELLADGEVLGKGVSGAESDLDATPAEMVHAGELLSQTDRVVKVIVQDQRTNAESGGAVSDGHERYQG
jgi:hypothetical protein